MTALAKLIRHTPGADLKAYFASRSAEFLEPAIQWTGQKGKVIKQVLGVVENLDDIS